MSSLSQFYGATNVSVVKSIQRFWLKQESSSGSGFSTYYSWSGSGTSTTELTTKNVTLPQTVNPDKTSISFVWYDNDSPTGLIGSRLSEVKVNSSGTRLQVTGSTWYAVPFTQYTVGVLYVELIEYY